LTKYRVGANTEMISYETFDEERFCVIH